VRPLPLQRPHRATDAAGGSRSLERLQELSAVFVMRPILIDPNKTIESINARQASVGQSEHHREPVILSWLRTEDLTPSGPQPCPTRARAGGSTRFP
jgi:hypothetical protein